jgi:hypothetical protein
VPLLLLLLLLLQAALDVLQEQQALRETAVCER